MMRETSGANGAAAVGTLAGALAAETAPEAAPGLAALAHFRAAGFEAADVPILQPLDPFLELSGEDLRSRLFVTADAEGNEFCLRPEFTIPAALHHLAAGAGLPADQVFLGPVFRHRPGESGEFVQLSAESFGRTDLEAADAEILALTQEAVRAEAGAQALAIRIGDLALYATLLDRLALDTATRRRLGLALGEGHILATLDALGDPARRGSAKGLERYSGVLDALKHADPAEARAFVTDLLSMSGVTATAGRTAEDIAGRFLDRARQGSEALGPERIAILRRFLAIEGDPDQVAVSLRQLAAETSLDLAEAIDRFELRTGFIEARGLTAGGLVASAGQARNLDYYSGFVFEIRRAGFSGRPIAAGGRYDRLFERLGRPLPAIGAAIWIERLGAGASA